MISCLIVDDEPLARDVLESYISETTELKLEGICKNASEARELLTTSSIDLIFLDINMPQQSGISFYKTLVHKPLVIFTTAYADYAVEGFELDAVDYLLKPFSYERFQKAIAKVSTLSNAPGDFIMLKADRKTHKVNFRDIQYVESIGDYAKVFLASGQVLIVSETLKNLAGVLPKDQFMRVHKSHIISISYLEFIEGNQIQIAGTKIPIGQSYREVVKERFNK